jgi:DNA-binding NarL/FixJ family response regulator
MQLVKKPGESLYLSELLKDGGSKREQAIAMLNEGKSGRQVCEQLHLSPKTLVKWKQEAPEFDAEVSHE